MNDPQDHIEQETWGTAYRQHLDSSLTPQDELDIQQTLCEFFSLIDQWDKAQNPGLASKDKEA